jgi:GNAT superfamily N-acetyltransferase
MKYALRLATAADAPAIADLIARSARILGAGYYSVAQIEGALQGAFGVDAMLIRDGTYYVATTQAGKIVACGGWGRRRTLFGSSARAERDESWLDPRTEAARVRAFFVDPAHARQGLGQALLEQSEAAAVQAGFASFELMATLPGIPFYEKYGYVGGEAIGYPLPNGLELPMVPMRKRVTALQPSQPAG